MKKYPKINSIFKRVKQGPKIGAFTAEYSRPEFKFLKDLEWIGTEKVHGTCLRVIWNPFYFETLEADVEPKLTFKGKSDTAQVPVSLLNRLEELFTVKKFMKLYPETPMCLYGEGFGAGIQEGGGNYIPDGVDFILFDIKIDQYWLKRESIEDIASKLEIQVVPIIHRGTLAEAVKVVKGGFFSWIGANCRAEGLVLKPAVDLIMQNGERVITKIKYKDKWETEE